jgi:uncharacterized Zn-binding protein involved in type VI secretion
MNSARLGDCCSGHDACPPRPIISASPTVFINNKKAARLGDALDVHECIEHLPHGGNITSGSLTVFINGKAAARIGDAVSCGGNLAQGSPNVFIG